MRSDVLDMRGLPMSEPTETTKETRSQRGWDALDAIFYFLALVLLALAVPLLIYCARG